MMMMVVMIVRMTGRLGEQKATKGGRLRLGRVKGGGGDRRRADAVRIGETGNKEGGHPRRHRRHRHRTV